MAEYQNREQNYSKTLGDLIGAFTTHCVEADSMSKDEAIDRTIKMFNAGNFDLKSSVSLIGMDTPLETNISVPKAIIANLNPLVISQAEMETSMSVSAHTESEQSVDEDIGMEGSGSGGFGPIKVKVKISSHTSVHSSQKRSSDYRATCDTKLVMIQGQTPEGLSRLLDAMYLTVDKGMELNELLIEQQAAQLREQVDGSGGTDDADDGDDDFSDSDSDSTDNNSDDNNDNDSFA